MEQAAIKEILQKVRQIEVRTRRLADNTLAGSYHSVFKGRGMNFDEVREYVPGDDIRAIDWNVTARTGVPHVKKFTEERELTIMLVIDLSASGSFGSGSRSKREVMAELAAALAFSAVRNNDKVGLLLFSDFTELFISPNKGRSHILRVIRETLFFQPQGRGTNIIGALDFFRQVTKRRCVTFLISDFCLPGDFDDSLQKLRPKLQVTGRRHDLIAVSVIDPRELELPQAGWITLEDAESGEQILLNTADAWTRQAYTNLTRDQRGRFARTVRGLGIDLLELSTDKPYLAALMDFFRSRSQRMAR
ncbi:DUF58 domain-containing protein [Candidatus Electronema halotolerans]